MSRFGTSHNSTISMYKEQHTPPPPISCEFEYAWAITCTLHSHACQPQPNKRNVSKPQLSHKKMVLGFHTLWNFLPPSVSFYSIELLTVSRTNVQAWSLGAWPDFSWRWQSIPDVFQILTKKKKKSRNSWHLSTTSVSSLMSRTLLIVNLSCSWLRLSAWLFRHNTPFCDGSWYLIWPWLGMCDRAKTF
jgi:hypothetical protein